MSATRKAPRKPAKKATGKTQGLSADELDAMKEALRERKSGKADGESEVLAKIATMPEPDRTLARRIHEIVRATAPALASKTWYGMPAYANEDGKVVCFFQGAHKFKYRYATLGFMEAANLDDGSMWATTFAVTELTLAVQARIGALVKQAVS
jgi:uncharacterized protein YdhG (YjbR/CyaY superfamily)